MVVTEIFRSIQGEGTRTGLPCVFVRLTGCNLRCVWCDTAYAFHGGVKKSLDEVMAEVRALAARPGELSGNGHAPSRGIHLVEITGGEPLLQPECAALAEKLLGEGYTVMIETSGERYAGELPREVVKIVDVKCPDSGEFGTFEMRNLDVVDAKDEIKFVLASRRDFEFAREFTREHRLAERVGQVIFSPVYPDPAGKWHGLDSRALAEWILEEGLPVRLGLQLHKFIWPADMQGV
ncbi:MAG TPA: radical SAM protein [Patescibacteria group bacterium]|nr:radical SAM protein [Patescibacteria group bacterium]